ncbi:MAG: MOSC domain-containing protein [Caldithrix sp.]|nr:MOSC domain-containing protein [Caldithrix sp.]
MYPMNDLKVHSLFYYPVKSCRGIALQTAALDTFGIEGDRHFMITDEKGRFMTQRRHPGMSLICPEVSARHLTLRAKGMPDISIDLRVNGTATEVLVWKDYCQAMDMGDGVANWLSRFLGRACRLVQKAPQYVRRVENEYNPDGRAQVSFADGFPLLLISEASLQALNERLPSPMPMDRFRPNIVLSGGQPFQEDRWQTISIGSVRLTVAKPCERCVVTTVNQQNAQTGKEPLHTLSTFRSNQRHKVEFGQNLIHQWPGVLNKGDRVKIKQPEFP